MVIDDLNLRELTNPALHLIIYISLCYQALFTYLIFVTWLLLVKYEALEEYTLTFTGFFDKKHRHKAKDCGWILPSFQNDRVDFGSFKY